MPLLTNITAGTTVIKFPKGTKYACPASAGDNCFGETNVDAGDLAITIHPAIDKDATASVQITYVPYNPCAINYAQTNAEVLSGIFSGCVMAAYNDNNGSRRVAHVHTGSDFGEGRDCKTSMGNLLNGNYTEIISFKPFDRGRDGDEDKAAAAAAATASKFGAYACTIFGLIDANNNCYTLFCEKHGPDTYLVKNVIDNTANTYTY